MDADRGLGALAEALHGKGIDDPGDLTLRDFMKFHEWFIKPTDPVEVRTGSILAVRSIAHGIDPGGPQPVFYGLPVIVDETLAPNRIEIRARDGSVVAWVEIETANLAAAKEATDD
jgi:hypothetical protein